MGKRAQALAAITLALLVVPIYAAARPTGGRDLDRFVYLPFMARPVVTVVTPAPTAPVAATAVVLESTATPADTPVGGVATMVVTPAPVGGLDLTATAVDGVATDAPTSTPTIEPTPTLPPFPPDGSATPALGQ